MLLCILSYLCLVNIGGAGGKRNFLRGGFTILSAGAHFGELGGLSASGNQTQSG